MELLSARLLALSPSETFAMAQKSNELKAQGFDVINMSVGEPDFYTPDHIKEAAKKAVEDNFSFYSPVAGYPDLKKAISDKLKRENGLEYTPVSYNSGKFSNTYLYGYDRNGNKVYEKHIDTSVYR